MPYIPDIDPRILQSYIDGSPSRPASQFPPNLAASLPEDIQKKMWQWMLTNYVWPQIQERMPFEPLWDKILNMVRIELPYKDLFSNPNQDATKAKQDADQGNSDQARVADSVICDAVQRLSDITSFIAFKEGLPVQFAIPDYVQQPYATKEYRPLGNRVDGGNALLQWNSDNHKVKRQSRIVFRHHYTYGVAFVLSDFKFRIQMRKRQNNMGQIQEYPEITDIGTTFEPISLRKLWLNWRIPVYDMEAQPCPFFFEETPRFSVQTNLYDPVMNPFGYLNLEKIGRGEMIYTGPEMDSIRKALSDRLNSGQDGTINNYSVAQILKPEHSVEAKWTLYPMMPYDPEQQAFEFYDEEKTQPVPMKRFVMETWGTNVTGNQVIIRLQENYYPKDKLCLYASCHMPDLDSGAYAPSIGQLLEAHYKEIVLCKEQFLTNKDLTNDPPSTVQVASPAMGHKKELNKKGACIEVNGENDVNWRQIPDATASTVAMMQHLREQGQTTSKSVDAIMGKAMGARTTATEASNAFETSMSAVTTDIDFLVADIHGEYAERTWDYSQMWIDPDLLFAITGQFGFAMRPEDMWLSISLKTNIGSTYVQKIVRQQNTRYILEASRGEPYLDRPMLWTELLDDMGFDGARFVDDQGKEQQIQLATLQAVETYMGKPTLVDPDQDHSLAIRVKTSFIKDRSNIYNTSPEYAQFGPMLIQQIEQHQWFLQLQLQMQLVQQQMQVAQRQLGIHQENPPEEEGGQPGKRNAGGQTKNAGAVASQGGGAR